MESGSADTALGRIAYRRLGDGPAALLWHSMMVDSHTWDRILPALAEHRDLIVVDGPPFGASGPIERVRTIRDCADAAMELLEALDIEAVDWAGNAWGGHVGIAAAAHYPDRVRSLVAIGAPTQPLGGAERAQVRALLPLVSTFGWSGAIRKAVLSALLNDETRAGDEAAVRLVERGFLDVPRREFVLAVRSFMLGRTDAVPDALRIAAPTLFAAGDDRVEWGPAHAAAVADRMPAARTATLHGVRGIAPLEQPERTAALIMDFWASLEPR